jgi:hypothetical protein
MEFSNMSKCLSINVFIKIFEILIASDFSYSSESVIALNIISSIS